VRYTYIHLISNKKTPDLNDCIILILIIIMEPLTQGAVRSGPVLVTGAGAALCVVGPVSGALVRAHGLGQLTAGPAPARLTVTIPMDTHTVGRAAGLYAVH